MTANENERFEQFAAVLQTELLERTKKTMELLVPEKEPCSRLPFIQTPSFFDIYAEVVKVGIFPVVLSRRPVRAIVGDVDWVRDGREYLLTVLDDRSNAVYTSWDYAWDALWAERKATASSSSQPERKKGFLGSLFGRKTQAKPETRPADDEDAPVMEGLYSMLNRLSDKKGYLPLFHDDLKVFKALVRVKPARVLAACKELAQYHHQEFVLTGHDQAKAGVMSDALQKWQFNLPDRIGECLVVKAAVDFEHVNKAFIGKYIRQSARTQEEAERGMPYLTIYWKAMPNVVVPQE